MKRTVFVLIAVAALAVVIAVAAPTSVPGDQDAVAIDTGKLPAAYRNWRLISVAREEGDLDDIRAILGNDAAIKAYRDGTRPFPDGTIIARLAGSYDSSEENNKTFGRRQSFVAERPKNGVQFMVKDSKKYASTGGWKYAHFDDGKPLTDAAMIQSCFDCHQAVKDKERDFVFTLISSHLRHSSDSDPERKQLAA